MPIVKANVYPFCFRIQRKLGNANHPNPPAWYGIYQQRKCRTGRETVKMKFYKPTNPRTEKQQANRQKLASANLAWKSLTDEQKKVYNKNAIGTVMTGYNLFIKKFLLSN